MSARVVVDRSVCELHGQCVEAALDVFSFDEAGEPIPYDELPLRVNRIAYRAFSRDPDLSFEEFEKRLGREVFGAGATPQAVEDLLELQAAFARERTWSQPSPARMTSSPGTVAPPRTLSSP